MPRPPVGPSCLAPPLTDPAKGSTAESVPAKLELDRVFVHRNALGEDDHTACPPKAKLVDLLQDLPHGCAAALIPIDGEGGMQEVWLWLTLDQDVVDHEISGGGDQLFEEFFVDKKASFLPLGAQ